MKGFEGKEQLIFKQIVQRSADGVVVIDENRRIILYNAASRRMFGWSTNEILGKPIEVLLPPRYRAHHADHIATFVSGDSDARYMGDRNGHIVGLRAGGNEIMLNATILKINVGDKHVMVAILRDISDRIRCRINSPGSLIPIR